MSDGEKKLEWFYEKDGIKKGPVAEDEMKPLIESGFLQRKCPVWKNGYPQWMPIDQTELQKFLTQPPGMAIGKPNNIIFWLLALAPLLGLLLEEVVARAVVKDAAYYMKDIMVIVDMQARKYWFVSLILNIILCTIDFTTLKKAGYEVSNVKGFVWLVPVYIYKRIKLTNYNWGPFIVWLISFLLTIIA